MLYKQNFIKSVFYKRRFIKKMFYKGKFIKKRFYKKKFIKKRFYKKKFFTKVFFKKRLLNIRKFSKSKFFKKKMLYKRLSSSKPSDKKTFNYLYSQNKKISWNSYFLILKKKIRKFIWYFFLSRILALSAYFEARYKKNLAYFVELNKIELNKKFILKKTKLNAELVLLRIIDQHWNLEVVHYFWKIKRWLKNFSGHKMLFDLFSKDLGKLPFKNSTQNFFIKKILNFDLTLALREAMMQINIKDDFKLKKNFHHFNIINKKKLKKRKRRKLKRLIRFIQYKNFLNFFLKYQYRVKRKNLIRNLEKNFFFNNLTFYWFFRLKKKLRKRWLYAKRSYTLFGFIKRIKRIKLVLIYLNFIFKPRINSSIRWRRAQAMINNKIGNKNRFLVNNSKRLKNKNGFTVLKSKYNFIITIIEFYSALVFFYNRLLLNYNFKTMGNFGKVNYGMLNYYVRKLYAEYAPKNNDQLYKNVAVNTDWENNFEYNINSLKELNLYFILRLNYYYNNFYLYFKFCQNYNRVLKQNFIYNYKWNFVKNKFNFIHNRVLRLMGNLQNKKGYSKFWLFFFLVLFLKSKLEKIYKAKFILNNNLWNVKSKLHLFSLKFCNNILKGQKNFNKLKYTKMHTKKLNLVNHLKLKFNYKNFNFKWLTRFNFKSRRNSLLRVNRKHKNYMKVTRKKNLSVFLIKHKLNKRLQFRMARRLLTSSFKNKFNFRRKFKKKLKATFCNKKPRDQYQYTRLSWEEMHEQMSAAISFDIKDTHNILTHQFPLGFTNKELEWVEAGFGNIILRRVRRNFFFTFTDIKGNTIFAANGGRYSVKKRKERFKWEVLEAYFVRFRFLAWAFNLRLLSIKKRVKNFYIGRKLLKELKWLGFAILSISPEYTKAHNGCRRRKKRRL